MTGSPPRFDVTSFGETMVRLSVPAGRQIQTSRTLDLNVGGSESNVCAALAGLGRHTAWCGTVTDDPPGQLVLRELRAAKVDVTAVAVQAGRMGVYYAELAEPPLPVQITYDRQDSVASRMSVDTIEWATLLDSRLLHLTGITPALSASCAELTQEAVRRAKAEHVAVSFDVNYRSHLWDVSDARRILADLIKDIDVLICSRRDAQMLTESTADGGRLVDELRAMTAASWVVMSTGADGAIAAANGGAPLKTAARPVRCVDRLGAGDALAAGVLDGWLDGSLSAGLERGVALSTVALATAGDMVSVPRSLLPHIATPEAQVRR